MFVFLSKFLPQFIYPTGLVTIILFVVLVLHKSPKTGQLLIISALLILWLSGSRFVARGLAQSLEWQYLPHENYPEAEAIVLLGGGTLPAIYPRQIVEVSGAGDRVLYAAWLYKQGKAPTIFVTGGILPWSNSPSYPAKDMAEILEMLDIPKEVIQIESESVNTYENALFTKKILSQKGINKIILVTSAQHMPRSVMLFEKQGFEVIPAPTDFGIIQNEEPTTFVDNLIGFITGFMPSASNIDLTTQVLKEYIGIWVYKLRGWA